MAPEVTEPRGWNIGVVVPARDEGARIGACVGSILVALAETDATDIALVVVADGCGDDTTDAARRAMAGRGEVVECSVGSVGRARRLGAARACALLPGAEDRTWLATTDADVRVDDFAELAPEVGARWAASYATRPDGTHPHVHGANLGVRADAYRAVGGWPAVATVEDHALWDRLRDGGWPTVSTVDAWVTTSGRRRGRAPLGFAAELRRLEDAG